MERGEKFNFTRFVPTIVDLTDETIALPRAPGRGWKSLQSAIEELSVTVARKNAMASEIQLAAIGRAIPFRDSTVPSFAELKVLALPQRMISHPEYGEGQVYKLFLYAHPNDPDETTSFVYAAAAFIDFEHSRDDRRVFAFHKDLRAPAPLLVLYKLIELSIAKIPEEGPHTLEIHFDEVRKAIDEVRALLVKKPAS